MNITKRGMEVLVAQKSTHDYLTRFADLHFTATGLMARQHILLVTEIYSMMGRILLVKWMQHIVENDDMMICSP